MFSTKIIRSFLAFLPLFLLPARAAVMNATWNSASDVPVTAASYTATGNTVNFTLNFAPEVGTNLRVVNNTGLPFIQGTFGNLSQGQKVALTYGGISYNFVATYYGGTGNDLMLQWAPNRPVVWGQDYSTSSSVPVEVTSSGVLSGKTIISIAADYRHSLALCSDGTVAAWGLNTSGQLGDNSTTTRNVPVAVTSSGVLSGKTVISIAAGEEHSLALCSDGTVAAWGSNGYGQLGDNSTTYRIVPVAVTSSGALSGKTVISIAAGFGHSLALCSDGTLAAWGYNTVGQLGDNSTTQSKVPVAVTSSGALSGKTVISIAAGSGHNLALCSDGTLAAWGSNYYGELGNGTTSFGAASAPVAVTSTGVLSGKTVIAVVAGKRHSLALCSDGTLAAWGENDYGQLGDNSTTNRSVPVAITSSGVLSGKTVIAVAAGQSHSLALCSDGTVAAWGFNALGQLGDNSTTNRSVPVAVTSSGVLSGKTMISLAGGERHSLAIVAIPPSPEVSTASATSIMGNGVTLNGMVNALSNNTTVYFEYGLTTAYGSTIVGTPSLVTGSTDTAVSANIIGLLAGTNYHYRLVATNALGTTTGANMTFITASSNANLSSLTLGNGTLSPAFSSGTTVYTASVFNATTTIRPILADTTATVRVNGALVSSDSFSSAISLAVGANVINTVVTAQDGVTTKTYSVTVTRPSVNANLATLVPSEGTLSPAFSGATTAYTSSVNLSTTSITLTPTVADATATVKVNGTLVASGAASSPIPLNVGSTTITTVVTAQDGSTKTYTLVVSRLNLVTTYSTATAVAVTLDSFVATGKTANFAINFAPAASTNLTVVNNTGLSPVSGVFNNLAQGQIVHLDYGGVIYQFVANYYGGTGNDLILQWANNRLLAWGANGSGQLGDGSVVDRSVPNPVTNSGELVGKTVTAMVTGGNHSLVLCSDGKMAAWGYNGYGQLGNSGATDSLVPVPVSISGTLAGKTVSTIAAGQYHNLALCTDGTLVAWGQNFHGQLGNGNTTDSSVPVAVNRSGVLSGKTIVAVAAGTYHSFALCSDGTLAAWGYNDNGELGNGGSGFSSLPVAVDRSGVLAGKTISVVFAGAFHNLALCTDGSLAAWGYNGYRQLGNNSAVSSNIPVLVNVSGVLAGKTILTAAASYDHSTALCTDGTLAAWGYNGNGELGDGSNVSSPIPVAVDRSGVLAGKTIFSLSGGAGYNLAFCSDGTLVTWGYSGNGELGTGSLVSSSVPVVVNSSALRAGEKATAGKSSASSMHSLALISSPPLPLVTTLAAISITATSAVLKASVNANGSSTVPSFDYGLTTSYGASVAGTPATVTGTSTTPVSATVSGLTPGTVYHYRITATNAGGIKYSTNVIFTTAGYNANLSNLALSSATLNPVFAPATTNYTASVASTTTAITITPTVATPTSTVKVNGTSVISGNGSPPVSLVPGSNSISIVVTAQDGTTIKSYTVSVTRQLPTPEISVTQAGANIPDGGSRNFGAGSSGRSASLTFSINNTGEADLTGLGIMIDGPGAPSFVLTAAPTAPVPGPTGTTAFTVTFAPTASGPKTAVLHISNNDSDENPFDITLTGVGVTSSQDTDGDGLNDAAEFQMEMLGFDWQTSQLAMVAAYFSNANIGGLYTMNQFQALQVDAPTLSKNPTTGLFKLRIGIQKSTNLLNFTPFLMTSPQTTISGDGKLEFEFASPDNAAFYRLLAE